MDMHQIHAHYALEGTSNYQGMNLKVDYDIYTSVACAIGPSMNYLVIELIFPSKTTFYNLIKFPMTKLLKIQYLLHLKSIFFQITCIKTYSLRIFEQLKNSTKFFL